MRNTAHSSSDPKAVATGYHRMGIREVPEILSVGEAGDTTDTDSVLKMLTTILLPILALMCSKGAGGMINVMYQISTACILTEITIPMLMV